MRSTFTTDSSKNTTELDSILKTVREGPLGGLPLSALEVYKNQSLRFCARHAEDKRATTNVQHRFVPFFLLSFLLFCSH